MAHPTPPAVIIPQDAVQRLMRGDAEVLFAAFSHGLTPAARWPATHQPLLHGLAYHAPPRSDEMVRAVLAAGGNPLERFIGLDAVEVSVAAVRPEHTEERRAQRCKTVQALVEHVPADQRLASWLVGATDCNALDLMAVLMGQGLDPNALDPTGVSPLEVALERGFIEALHLLVDGGAAWEAEDAAGTTAADRVVARAKNAEAMARIQTVILELRSATPTSDAKVLRL